MNPADFILASGSSRRRELLEQIGARFDCQPMDVDESLLPNEAAADYVTRLAVAKARAARDLLSQTNKLPVMGSDTTVVIDDRILAKPDNAEEGVDMLLSLAGRSHRVLTAVALISGRTEAVRLSNTQVWFCPLSRDQAQRYWQTGEPADKAGGYGIQGYGAVFVEKIEGSYSGVVGLPLAETRELLELFDIPYWQ
jgi:septum formation protein